VVLALVASVAAQPQQGGGKIPPPKWLDDEGKDLFVDIEADDLVYGDTACEMREKLLKKMAGHGEKDASEHRTRVLMAIGICALRKGDFSIAKLRLENAISEMNVPNEEVLLQTQQVAHVPLLKQAAGFLHKVEVSQGATAMRRAREIMDRNLKKILKQVHKQLSDQNPGGTPPLQQLTDELPGYGKSGQFLPMLLPQVPLLKGELAMAEVVDQAIDTLDRRVASVDTTLKMKRLKLDSKSKGNLMYVRALFSEAVVPAERSGAVQEFVKENGIKNFLSEAAKLDKPATLLKRTKDGSGCKEGKGLEKTCKALRAVPDVASNSFGESRIVLVKPGKVQKLEICETNANIGILVAAADGVTVTIKDVEEPMALSEGEAVVVDFCREVSLESSGSAGVPVLFAQAWHPEFAALERSTQIRARSKAFSFSEDDVKAVTKVVNDYAKKSWEKTASLWRTDSPGNAAIKEAIESEKEEAKQKQAAADEAKRAEEAGNDEERQKALAELERKRAAKRKREEEAEQARLRRKKLMEEERAKRDPWLNFPSVLDAERKLDELKEARREANAKLEFDLSTQLTKDISAQERALKKAIKAAKKAHKKGVQPTDEAAKTGDATSSDADGDNDDSVAKASEIDKVKEELKAVKQKKKEAAEAEDFKLAKKLKQEEADLEKKLQKLEL